MLLRRCRTRRGESAPSGRTGLSPAPGRTRVGFNVVSSPAGFNLSDGHIVNVHTAIAYCEHCVDI